MTAQLLRDGRLDAPFVIFVRRPHGYSDADILRLFGLDCYERASSTSMYSRHAIVGDAGDWTMLADNWYYTLWHMDTTAPAIDAIGKHHEVYACMEGDCDRSFEFVYYRDGSLFRKYAVTSPGFSDRIVAVDFGAPLPGEAALLMNDGYFIGIELAESLAIKTRFTNDDLRIYLPRAGLLTVTSPRCS